ncbi:hypothetical protein [Tsukamurella sp. PLM1]|uniref:hypothetical protein n=1 Tax=Tsukamurella sp. PLM1 TaxID=2929795 RepID=UPI002052F498|nr:hypothetical protein [Tsukamurella sp. PLM1]BDH58518.1 hypothetical protein MTP03_34570 [Tsukamurella sp. PLM1]
MLYRSDDRLHGMGDGVPQADPADVAEQVRTVDLDTLIDDYPWVRRDEVLIIDGRRFFV